MSSTSSSDSLSDLPSVNREEKLICEQSHEEILKKEIEEEATLIVKIYPEFQLETVREKLTKLGNLPKRSRYVLRQLTAEHEKKMLCNFPQSRKFISKENSNENNLNSGSERSTVKNENFLIKGEQVTIEESSSSDSACNGDVIDLCKDSPKFPSSRQAKRRKPNAVLSKIDLHDLCNSSRENVCIRYPHTPNFNQNTKKTNRTQESLSPKEDPALYTTKFNVENFLEGIPDPETYFRKNRYSKPWSPQCERYATCALYNIYSKINLDVIKKCIYIAPNFLAACYLLDKEENEPNGKLRTDLPMPPPVVDDVPLLKEIAYKTHHKEIVQFIKTQKEALRLRISNGMETGLIYTCTCCYGEGFSAGDLFKCEENCCICGECIRSGVEISFSNGQNKFKCLNNCGAQYSLHTLQRALPEQLFSKITNQPDGTEYCPFCNFVCVPGTKAKLLSCLNPDCMKDSCRECKTPSHFPAACEKDENVMARTYIENKMTEAILRECYECKMKFVKSGGCNTITCPCGARMCYVCRKPVTDLYLHRGCQKHSVARLDEERVLKAAQEAKKEVFTILKIDPTVGIKLYFEKLRKINLQLKEDEEQVHKSSRDAIVFQGASKRKRDFSDLLDVNVGASSSGWRSKQQKNYN